MSSHLRILKLFSGLSLSILFSVVTPTLANAAGKGSDGGGFRYRDTAIPNLIDAQKMLINSLLVMSQTEIDQITQKYTQKNLDKNKLVGIIRNLKYAPTTNVPAKMDAEDMGQLPEGIVPQSSDQNLDMTYSVENHTITALQPLFESINKPQLEAMEVVNLRRKIVHEASHLFGIGIGPAIDNKDDVSYALSSELVGLSITKRGFCGYSGSLEQRKENCASYGSQESNWGSLLMVYRGNSFSSATYIYDARDKLNFLVAQTNNISADFKKETPDTLCAKVSSLEGQISWRPITFEEIKNMFPNPFDGEGIILEGQKKTAVEYGNNFKKATYSIISIYQSLVRQEDRLFCVGEVK